MVNIFKDESDKDHDQDESSPTHVTDSGVATPGAGAYRIQTRQFPYFDVFHGHHIIHIMFDSCATSNMIRQSKTSWVQDHVRCSVDTAST